MCSDGRKALRTRKQKEEEDRRKRLGRRRLKSGRAQVCGRRFVLELLVAKGQKEFVSQVEKGPEVAEAMARLDEAEDKMLEVIAQSCEKATEVV